MLLAPGVEGELLPPDGPVRAAVLVLSGSSGRVDVERARLLADHGALALALRYFGGTGQPPGICEVPLEIVTAALDLLRDRAPGARLGIVGTSKGAEAALAVAALDPRVAAVAAMAPTDVVWANVGPGLDGADRPQRSSWAWRGQPLPFVTYDESWVEPGPEPVAVVDLYQTSHARDPAQVAAARLRVEQAHADLLLVAGEDDRMWPAAESARAIAGARRAAGRHVEVVVSTDAGHRVLFPGEADLPPSARFRYGGNASADRALGRLAWPRVLAVLGLAPTTTRAVGSRP